MNRLIGRPSYETTVAICKNWELLGKSGPGACIVTDGIIGSSLTGFTWTVSQASSKVMSEHAGTLSEWILICAILGFYTLYIDSMVTDVLRRGNATRSFDSTVLAAPFSRMLNLKYFFVPLLVSAPIYIVGMDFGRWFAITCINYILIMLSREIVLTELEYSKLSRGNTEHRSSVINSSVPTLGFYGNLFVFLLILFYLRLPHLRILDHSILEEPLRTVIRILLRAFG